METQPQQRWDPGLQVEAVEHRWGAGRGDWWQQRRPGNSQSAKPVWKPLEWSPSMTLSFLSEFFPTIIPCFFFFFFFFLSRLYPNVGLELTTPRSRVACSTDWARQGPHSPLWFNPLKSTKNTNYPRGNWEKPLWNPILNEQFELSGSLLESSFAFLFLCFVLILKMRAGAPGWLSQESMRLLISEL